MLLAYNTTYGWRCCLCKTDYELKQGKELPIEFLKKVEKDLYTHLDRVHYRTFVHYVEEGTLPKTQIPKRRYEGPFIKNQLI